MKAMFSFIDIHDNEYEVSKETDEDCVTESQRKELSQEVSGSILTHDHAGIVLFN